ncbi:MAG: hypothetical protein MJ176_01065 [Treponema sp.]|nr:hypothetical protein [Treponema sp.]
MAMQNEPQTQKMEGKSREEVRTKLHNLYGNDYEIVAWDPVLKGGFLGLFQTELVQATFYVKKRQIEPQPEVQSSVYQQTFSNYGSQGIGSSYRQSEEERLASNQQAILQSQNSVLMQNQISMMQEMKDAMDVMKKQINQVTSPARAETHETISRIEELLEKNDFSMSYIKRITERLRSTFSLEYLDDYEKVEKVVVDWIGQSVEIAEEKVHRPPHVFILVGPTGVGKTTTLIKLLTQKYLVNKPKDANYVIKLITTDTMRVGAREQLAGWGTYLNLEVVKAENNDDLRGLYERYKDHCDAIFIDTSGYSPNDSKHIARMKNMLEVPGLNPDIYLMMDSKTKVSDLINIMQNYEPFGYGSVIISKCDEAGVLGNVVSALSEKHKTLSYITTGQSAARDIKRASPLDFIMKLEGFTIDRNHIEEKFNGKGEF